MAGGSVPSDSYDEVSTHIYCQLSRNLLPDEEHSLRFAPRGIAEQVLHDENLGSVFRSLSLSPTDWPDDFNENVFVQKIKDKKLHNVLAIILYASCNITAAQAFISKLVIGDGSSNLPLSRDACLELFDGSHAQTRKYRDAQPIFCTVVIGDPHSLKIQDLKEWRLPYLEPTYIGDGSFGEVYAVKIAAGHLVTKTQDGQSFYDEIPVARKDYLLNPKRYGESEYNIINAILTSRFNCKNIVESFGSIEVVNDTKPRYSLFMPLAKCDLQKYMEEKGPERLKTVVEKSSILWSAVGLTEGLEFLHYKMSTTVDRKNFACYHMDLKPANILLFEDGDRMIWKLSDFGMSRVKFLNEDEQDFEQPFLKRNQSLSKTKNLRAEGTYLAPETQASTKTSGRESDVWSLGAIISTLFTYMEEGRDGLEKYTSARNEYKGSKGYDYFFLTSDSKRFEKARRHPAVAEWHAKLVKKAKKRDPNEAKIVQHLLGYIDNSVLVLNPESRRRSTDAKEFVRKMEDAYKGYKKLAEPAVADGHSSSHASEPAKHGLWNPFSRERHVAPDISQWTMSLSGPKGCSVTADATLAAYWTDKTIALCTAQMLSNAGSSGTLDNGPVFTLPGGENVTWRDVRLTEVFLVASTNKDRFQCYVFDFRGGRFVEPNLEKYYIINISSCPPPQNIALSDDSKWFACVTTGRRSPLRLRWIRIEELISLADSDSTSLSNLSSPTSSMHPSVSSQDPFLAAALSSEAGQVTHFTFSAAGNLHVAIRPELTVRGGKHNISFPLFQLGTNSAKRLDENANADGQDNSNLGFLTTFAPLNTQCAFSIITRERRLWIHPYPKGAEVTFYQHDVPKYRILHILVDHDDKAIYAFATGERRDRLLLLRMSVPTRDIKPSPALIAELPDLSESDRIAVALSRDDGPRHMLITTQRGAIIKLIVAS